ncbi:MAG: hypothetical protein K2Y08_04020 [Alphaproteobacteria bacterium]|nr:hypothetical protein [Alphaproteobacteria bacterium]
MIQKSLFFSIIFATFLIESTPVLSLTKKFTCPENLPAMGDSVPFSKAILETKENEMVKITCEYEIPGAFMSIWLPESTLCKFLAQPQQLISKGESVTCYSNNAESCSIEYIVPQTETSP